MSSYNGRRGPNVSQYVANLNTIPSPTDAATEPQNLDDDFFLFTKGDFPDFDLNAGNIDLTSPLDFTLDADTQRASEANPTITDANRAGEPKMDFLNTDFQFTDFSNFPNPIVDPSIPSLGHVQPSNFAAAPAPFTSPVTSAVSPVIPGFDQSNGKKRKLELGDSNSEQALDETARVAAEEDKRRRNTAASARFRIKKKQREQVLEKTAKEMTDRVNVLETRIQQLETENTWLKGLITEKNGGKATSSDIRAKLNKHEESNSERSTGNRVDGVGTKSEGTKA